MKKLYILLFILLISGCSTDKQPLKNALESAKKIDVEQVKENISSFMKGKKIDTSDKKIDYEVGAWQVYEDKETGFSLKYPPELAIGNDKDNNKIKLIFNKLDVNQQIGTSTPGEDYQILAKNIEKGENGENWGQVLENSREISKIGNKNVRKGVVLSKDDNCDVSFERSLGFVSNGKIVTLILAGPKEAIIKENIEYFKDGSEECPETKVWSFERQSEFYYNLLEKKNKGNAQNWFNVFDYIVETLKFESEASAVDVSKSAIVSEIYLKNNSDLKWIKTKIGKSAETNDKIAQIFDFENFTKEFSANIKDGIVKTKYFVSYNKNKYLSVVFIFENNKGDIITKNITVNLLDGKLMTAEDLLKSEKKDELVVLCDKKLQENILEYRISEYGKIEFKKEYLENFVLTEDGIRFDLSQEGKKELYVLLSFEELEDYLIDNESLK